MNNEQAAAEYAEKAIVEFEWEREEIEKAYLAGCAHTEPKWVSVSYALPVKGQPVLGYGVWIGEINGYNPKEKTISIVEWASKAYSEILDTDAYNAWLEDITHWMPLPTPPEHG